LFQKKKQSNKYLHDTRSFQDKYLVLQLNTTKNRHIVSNTECMHHKFTIGVPSELVAGNPVEHGLSSTGHAASQSALPIKLF
jgi:hypothetical protein